MYYGGFKTSNLIITWDYLVKTNEFGYSIRFPANSGLDSVSKLKRIDLSLVSQYVKTKIQEDKHF